MRVNPAVATGRVPVRAIVEDGAVLAPDQFRAEWLSMVFDVDLWESLKDGSSAPLRDLAIGSTRTHRVMPPPCVWSVFVLRGHPRGVVRHRPRG